MVARLDDLSGNGWTYSLLEPVRFVYRLKDGGRGGAGIVFAVTAEREAAYYIFTLALPMTLILFLAWMTHWLPADITPPRMGMASATVFSLIAFGVSFRLTLPKIAYLTDADRFVLVGEYRPKRRRGTPRTANTIGVSVTLRPHYPADGRHLGDESGMTKPAVLTLVSN
jgi:hypothetical protein